MDWSLRLKPKAARARQGVNKSYESGLSIEGNNTIENYHFESLIYVISGKRPRTSLTHATNNLLCSSRPKQLEATLNW